MHTTWALDLMTSFPFTKSIVIVGCEVSAVTTEDVFAVIEEELASLG